MLYEVITVLSGNINQERCLQLADKWFGTIPKRDVSIPELPVEPEQTEFREMTVERKVPDTMLYLAFHMSDRQTREFV